MAFYDDDDILDIPMSMPKRMMEQYSYTIYGRPKFGKSSICAEFPNALFFGFEVGQGALQARVKQVSDWKHFKSLVDKLVEAKEDGKTIPYQNYIIDTADVAWKYCQTYVCKKNGWTHPSEGEWGAGWNAVADEYFYEMDRLSKLGDAENPSTVINIAHHTEKEFKPKNKPKYSKIVPDVPSGAREVIVDKVDFIIFCDIDSVDDGNGGFKDVRRLYIRDNGEYEAGSRLRYMPEFVEYGDDAKTAFENFKNAFNEAVVKEFGALETSSTKTTAKKDKAEKVVEKKPSITKLQDAIEDEFTKLFKAGKTPTELVALMKEHTGVEKIGDITDVNVALAMLDVLRGISV